MMKIPETIMAALIIGTTVKDLYNAGVKGDKKSMLLTWVSISIFTGLLTWGGFWK